MRTTLTVAEDHPACEGHFPGAPRLPAVVLLDEALHAWENASGTPPGAWHVSLAKLTAAVQPGDTLILEHEQADTQTVRFHITRQALTVASGVLKRTAGA